MRELYHGRTISYENYIMRGIYHEINTLKDQ